MLLAHLSKNLFGYSNVMTELRRATARIKGTSGGKGHSYRCTHDGYDKLCKLYRNYDVSRPSRRIAYLQSWYPLIKIVLGEFIPQTENTNTRMKGNRQIFRTRFFTKG